MFGNGYFNSGSSGGGGGGTPSAPTQSVQFNTAGAFDGNKFFVYKSGRYLNFNGIVDDNPNIHNNPQSVTNRGQIRSGDFLSPITNPINIASITLRTCAYFIVGKVLHLSFTSTIDPILTTTATSFDLDLSTTDLSGLFSIGGNCSAGGISSAHAVGESFVGVLSANDIITFNQISGSIAPQDYTFFADLLIP